MSVSHVNPSALLQAQSAYNTTSAQKGTLPTAASNDFQVTNDFQNMVKSNFNSFANMKPEQILAAVKQTQAQNMSIASYSGSIAQSAFTSIPKALRHDEEVKRKAIVNEASMSEVIAATSEAKIVLQTAVAVRNKIFDAFDKIMNMPL